MNAFLIGTIGVAAAALFSIANRQFKNYASGEPSYLTQVEGRPAVAAVVVLAGAIVGSALITVIEGGSLLLFLALMGVFIALGVGFGIIAAMRKS